MAIPFKQTLENIRKEIIPQKNAEYHARMKTIVDGAIGTIDIDKMKKHFIDTMTKYPETKNVSTQWEFSLDPLFVDTLIWTDDNKYITNPIKPLELYFHYKGTDIKYVCTKQSDSKTQEFKDYLYSTDPDIQRLKNIFKEAFPDATIRTMIYIPRNSKAFMSIDINYTFNSGAEYYEMILSEPYRTSPGDFVKW